MKVRISHPLALAAACLLVASAGCGRIQARRDLKSGNAAFRARQYDDALALYELVPDGSDDRVRAALNSGYAHMAQYHFGSKHPKDLAHAAGAIGFFDEYLGKRPAETAPSPDFPDPVDIQNKVITLLIDTDRYQEAIERMKVDLEAATDPPQRMAILSGLAQAYDKWDQPTTAIAYHRMVIDEETEPQGKVARQVFVAQYCWDKSYRQSRMMEPIERNRWIDIGIAASRAALAIDPDHFEGNVYLNLLLRERAKVRVDPDEIADLYVEAVEYQNRARAIRAAQKKAEEEAAAKKKAEEEAAAGAQPASAADTDEAAG